MGRLQPRLAWDHKIYTARKLGELPPSATTENTHAPGPGGMPTSYNRYLPLWPLCMVCARTGVDNLLNRTLPTAGTSGSTKQVWGLLEQDSIYGRLRRFKYSCMVSSRIIFHIHRTEPPLIIPPHAPLVITVSTRDKLVSTQDRDFPGSFPVGMRGIWGGFLSQTYQMPTAWNHLYALWLWSYHRIE